MIPRAASAVVFAVAVLVLSASARAQEVFGARLSHANAVPPTTSPAGGRGWFSLDASSTVLRCRVETNASATHVHVRRGAAGVNGPLVVALTQTGPAQWEAPATALSSTDLAALWNEELYVAVFTNGSPPLLTGGDVRDQL